MHADPALHRDPPRSVGLAGSPNFRDAGGYHSACGARLRWRCLFRSGHLAALEDADHGRLAALDLQLVVDLRRDDEREQEPSALPDGTPVITTAINPGSQANALFGEGGSISDGDAMFAFMCAINRQFVATQSDAFAGVFAALLDSGAERVLFHCSAGKDRTGFVVAMLQAALGVPLDDIYADYLLSGTHYLPERELARARRKYRVEHLADAHLLPMLRVEKAYLDAAFEAIRDGYGDCERYLERGLGLDDAARRELRRRFHG